MDKDDIKVVICVTVCIFVLLGLIALAVLTVDKTRWNEGRCKCGGEWVYEQVVGGRSSYYIYRCDKCGKRKEFAVLR